MEPSICEIVNSTSYSLITASDQLTSLKLIYNLVILEALTVPQSIFPPGFIFFST